VELRAMMADMGAMVQEQGEALQVVEEQVDDAKAAVVLAHKDVVTAAAYQKSYRRKVCLALACGIIVIAVILIPLLVHFAPSIFSGGGSQGGGGGGGSPTPIPVPTARRLHGLSTGGGSSDATASSSRAGGLSGSWRRGAG
jgi:hypothetical protein